MKTNFRKLNEYKVRKQIILQIISGVMKMSSMHLLSHVKFVCDTYMQFFYATCVIRYLHVLSMIYS